MEFTTITKENLAAEHICCAISEKKGETCVSSKKAWMTELLDEGLVFTKLNERGKVFIEYIPADKAWYPIDAPGYMHINCFWISGKFKGQGISGPLLHSCIDDAKSKGMCGLTILSSAKKKPFLSDPGFLKHKGFLTADTAAPYFELLYLPFDDTAPVPSFRNCARDGKTDGTGMVLYYSNQCPHTDKYAPLIQDIAKQRGKSLELRKITTLKEARNAPSPFTTYSFFYRGDFITNEILSEKKFEKFLDSID